MDFLHNKKLQMIVYPSVMGIILIILGVVFWRSASFLATAVQQGFMANSEVGGEPLQINFPELLFVAKKLSIEVSQTGKSSAPSVTLPETPVITTSSEGIATSTPVVGTTTIPETIVENKADLSISILNSTGIKGLAGTLKILLVANGFTVSTTGNQPATEPITLIKIKASKKSYTTSITELTSLVQQKYTVGTTEPLSEANTNDIVIVIGEK
ncbi:MAG: LytR C-terminal domain-containing protein [Candidatus Paceibacterota bacterium]|jgi:hypothetical protein